MYDLGRFGLGSTGLLPNTEFGLSGLCGTTTTTAAYSALRIAALWQENRRNASLLDLTREFLKICHRNIRDINETYIAAGAATALSSGAEPCGSSAMQRRQ